MSACSAREKDPLVDCRGGGPGTDQVLMKNTVRILGSHVGQALSPATELNGAMPASNCEKYALVVTPLPYLIVYEVEREAVLILHIRHGARLWLQ